MFERATAAACRFHNGRGANMPVATIFVLLFLLVMVSLVGNVGRTSRLRVEVQNTADAVAYSAAVPLARGMNALAHAQHLSGELAAIGALHAALDGIYPDGSLDETPPFAFTFYPPGLINAWSVHQDNWERKLMQDPPPTRNQEAHDWFGSGSLGALIQFSLNPKRDDFGGGFQSQFIDKNEPYSKPLYQNLMAGPTVVGKIGYESARFAGELTGVMPDPESVLLLDRNNRQDANGNWIYDDLRGAIGDSYRRLKVVVFHTYVAQFYAGLLYEESTTDTRKNTKFFKDMTAESIQIANAALILQKKIVLETKALDTLLQATRETQSMNAAVWSQLAALDAYTAQVAAEAPQLAQAAMEGVRGEQVAEVYPTDPALPVVREAGTVAPIDSHWVRASTPWVQYHRRALLLWGQDTVLLGRFKDYYWRRTKVTTEGIAQRMKVAKGTKAAWNPFVMADTTSASNHRTQIWRSNSTNADQRFCVVGFAWRDDRSSFLPKLLEGPVSADGKIAAYSQAMIYAANPTVAVPTTGYQDNDGWDTLVWASQVVAHPGPGFDTKTGPDKDTPPDTVAQPIPKPDWQVRLVPASRAGEAAGYLSGLLGDFPANLANMAGLPQAFLAGH
jgi:hypothetical protein